MLKVIIFDLDGLLIDSQPLQYKAYNTVFSKYGAPITLENWHKWIHEGYSANSWIQKHKLPLQADAIRAEKKTIYNRLIRDELKLKPGALKLINALHGKYALCIASSSRLESIELVVEKFNLKSKFAELISDAENAKGKPHPDIFLQAAKKMSAKVEKCLVIEDSLAGLQAAKAAKMICIICPDTFTNLPHTHYQGADKIVTSLHQITSQMILGLQ